MPISTDEPLLVRLPDLGVDAVYPAPIAWRVREGARVRRGEPVVEVEGCKAVHALYAPADGVIVSVTAADEAALGDVLYTLRFIEDAPSEDEDEGRLWETTVRWPGGAREPPSAAEGVRVALCYAVLDTLPTAPSLLRLAMSDRGLVPLRLRVLNSKQCRWWHAELWLGSYTSAVQQALQEGPGPPALVTVSLLEEPGATAEPIERGLEIVFGPSAPVDDALITRLLLRVEPGHPARHLRRLAAALGEVLSRSWAAR